MSGFIGDVGGSLTLGNTSHTPGGLPGMLLNNEVHSLTSPSKAKFPLLPFSTPIATLTRVTLPTGKGKKKTTSSCFFLLTGAVVAFARHEE